MANNSGIIGILPGFSTESMNGENQMVKKIVKFLQHSDTVQKCDRHRDR